MKKLFTLLVLLVAIVTGAKAATTVTFKSSTLDDSGNALTNLSNGGVVYVGGGIAKVISTNTNTLGTSANKYGYRADRSNIVFKFDGSGSLTIKHNANSTGARYMTLSSFSSDKALADITSSDWATKTAKTITLTDTETTWEGGQKSAVTLQNSNTTWNYTTKGCLTVTWENLDAGYYVLEGAGSEAYIYEFTADISSDGKTNLVGAWSAPSSTFDFGSTATAPTFSVTPATATAGTDYSVAYSLVSGSNVTVDATNGITAIDTETAGTSVVKATITVIDGDNYKATTTEYETTITVNEEGGVTPAGGKYTITFNGKDEGDTDYFTNVGKHSFNTKFTGATYDGKAFTSGLKMESTTEIDFTTTAATSIVTIVQSTWSDTGIAFDGNTVASSTATAGTGYRVYTFTNVAAGSHSMKRGSASESGIFQITVEEIAAANAPVITVDPASAEYATGATADALTVSATASAGNLSYQWYSNTSASNEGGTAIDGETTASYTPSTETAGTYYYYVRVTDGNGSTNSDVATITVEDAVAPTISVTPTAPSTYLGVATTLTAEVTGVPNPTVKWYQNTAAATTGGTEVGTGLTYQPDVTTEGEFYYYAVASNSEGTATSQLITLTVTDPDKYITGNAYYMSVDEVAVAGENVYADDITMTIKDYEGGAANADNSVSGINSNYVAQITGTHNGWGTEFVATKNGTLSVGVIINGGKTFTLTNVTSFDYNGVQDEGNNNTSKSAGTNASNTWTPSKKQWTVLTFDVVAGTTYKLSVAGSKMGFYGFEFVPEGTTIPVTVTAAKYATFVPSQAVSFEGSGVKAFAAVYNEATGGATLNEVTAAPAGTPLVVNAEAGTYDLTVVATSETTAPAQNNLKVSDGTVEGDMQTIYGLKNGAQGVGFYPVTQNATIAAGKVYLQIPASEGAREFIGFGGEEVVTGIDAIENGTIDNDAPAYNLAGQKVGKAYKGIVIINGKKVVK